MQNVRLILYFVVGLMLGGGSVMAYAETKPAETVTAYGYSGEYSNGQTFCRVHYDDPTMTFNGTYCVMSGGNQYPAITVTTSGCTGIGWTLTGTICERPDCTPPQVRNPTTELCVAPACTAAPGVDGWYSAPLAAGGLSGTYCDGGCQYSLAWNLSNPTMYENKTTRWKNYTLYADGVACAANNPAPSTSEPQETSCFAKGMCNASINGNNACAPCEKTTTEQKNTQTVTPTTGPPVTTTTTTTQTCTGAGACTTTVNTTNSNSTTNSTTNTSPGSTSNGKGTATATGNGDYKLDLPTDYQRDATGLITNEYLKNIERQTSLDGGSDETKITSATASQASQDAADVQKEAWIKLASGETNPAKSSQDAWFSTMTGGWFDTVPMTGCVPFTSNFSGKVWTVDHCPIATKISDWGAYALYFTALVSVYIMLTPGLREVG